MSNSNFTTSNSIAPPPSELAHPHNSNMSPLTAVLCLVAVITVPIISYTFFVAMKCPRNPFRRGSAAPPAELCLKAEKPELVYGVKYRKSAEDGRKEAAGVSDQYCPVCLSVFAEGEEMRQLSGCKHAFHSACIDMWLYSHSNCPVCRAAVPVRWSKRVLVVVEEEIRRGPQDAADLI
ncbi:RING-H2 finger protein ATL33 [Sesamum indicum]|uniref:RING-H2 finger protein ATL33 n=1 Tax=Sesamum indicum TaxID=4182 RepID=A0A6I9T1U0_SESIN|nr:RING-H2 finger protein ATL33 [Sesamum indicum]